MIAAVSLRLMYLIFLRVLGLLVLLGRTASSRNVQLHKVDRTGGAIQRRAQLGGLINEYQQVA